MTAAGLYDVMVRHRRAVLGGLVLGVVAGVVGASRLRIDMSFRPTFIGDKTQLARTADHERVFGQVGFRDLVAIADVGDATDPRAIARVASLAEACADPVGDRGARSRLVPVLRPAWAPAGARHRRGAAPGHAALWRGGAPLRRGPAAQPAARRLIVGDGDRRLAVTASIDIPNEDFTRRQAAVRAFRATVAGWSAESGIATQVTGYPEVEQVYAEEVLRQRAA